MLVLSRRTGQKIVIGNEIVLKIMSVSGEGVRIGITAPDETSVHRFEVFKEIQDANRAAGIGVEGSEHCALKDLSTHLRIKAK